MNAACERESDSGDATSGTEAAAVHARLSASARRVLQALPPVLRRRRPLAVVVLAALIGALAGALAPVGGVVENADAAPGADEGSPAGAALPPKPDLTPFLTNRRWGISLLEERREREEREAAERAAQEPEPTDLTPLQAIGFVGVAVNTAERAVLLTLADGEVVRRVAGEALADGRVLAAVREDALVLEGANGQRETLLLFPLAPSPASE